MQHGIELTAIRPLAHWLCVCSRADWMATRPTGRRRTNHAALCALVRCLCRSAIHTRFVTSDWRLWLAAQMRRRIFLDGGVPVPLAATQTNHEARRKHRDLTSGNCFTFFFCHRSFDDTKTTWTKPSDPASYIGSLFQQEPVPYCGQYLMHNELAPTRPTHVQHIIKKILCAKAVDTRSSDASLPGLARLLRFLSFFPGWAPLG
jgi:hypothetical protein